MQDIRLLLLTCLELGPESDCCADEEIEEVSCTVFEPMLWKSARGEGRELCQVLIEDSSGHGCRPPQGRTAVANHRGLSIPLGYRLLLRTGLLLCTGPRFPTKQNSIASR